jgi:hypothetical protein
MTGRLPAAALLLLPRLAGSAEPRASDEATTPEVTPAPTQPPPPVEDTPADEETPAERRRRLRKEGPPEGTPPKRQADFLRRDTELRFRFGFNGYTPGPFSLFTAFVGWQEVGLTVDHGTFSWRDFTIGLGADAHYGGAWLLGTITQPIANYDDWRFRWAMWEAGGSLRTTFHWTRLRGVDPYLFGALGAGLLHLDARVLDWPLDTARAFETPYLRLEAGGGLSWLVAKDKIVVGVEARYLVTVQTRVQDRLDMSYTPTGESEPQTATFSMFPQHKPPKGFSWVVSVGFRF